MQWDLGGPELGGGRGLVSDQCRVSVGLPRIPSVRGDLGGPELGASGMSVGLVSD